MLTCGPPSLSSATPKGKGEDEESCSEDESSGDEDQTVSFDVIRLLELHSRTVTGN